jgi:FkbM family methyltransferase
MKKSIRNILNRFGYDTIKIPKRKNYFSKKENNRLNFYETPIGNYYLPTDNPNDAVINCMKYGEIFEPEIIETASLYIKEGCTVLDVGANFGQMTTFFSKMVGQNGKVYAFDADDFIFDVLNRNIQANGCNNVEPLFGAVHNKTGETLYFPVQDFERFRSYGSYGIDPQATKGREVKTMTMDSLKIDTPICFMKVDIQGSDLFAMQGAIETIKKNKMPILFEFEQQFQDEFKTSFQDYVDFVDSIGYKFEKVIRDINYLIVPR